MAKKSRKKKSDSYWGSYTTASEKDKISKKAARKADKSGNKREPVSASGRQISHTFWGRAWCKNIESYQDYASRLPRGRTYLRKGYVLDLKIDKGVITALVSGSSVYKIKIDIEKLNDRTWKEIKNSCAGNIGSLVDLFDGKLSDETMEVVTDKKNGLFPKPSEISMSCNCPDWSSLCKHLAAVLYGVGVRLDTDPELLFHLRNVDPSELIEGANEKAIKSLNAGTPKFNKEKLEDLFGIELVTT